MLKHNVCILNTGNPTYFHPGTGSLSAIDLSFCHPSLYLDLSWSVHEDLCGSDHYPVVITTTQSYDHNALSSWKLDKADWCTFSEACSEELTIANIEDSSVDSFTEKLIAIAENTIPKSKPRKRTVNTVWCNSDCKEGKHKDKQKSLQQLKTWNISKSNGPNAEKLSEPHADSRGKPLSQKSIAEPLSERSGMSLVKYQERNLQQAFTISR